MNLRKTSVVKALILAIALGMIAGLVACSSSSSTSTPTIAIAANTGGYTSPAAVGTAFGTLSATVTSNGSPVANASVVFTAPSSGASGVFTTSGTNTETDTTNSSGVAISSAFSANTVAGSYAVTATTTGAATPASFNLSNASGTAAAIAISGGGTQSVTEGATFAALAVTVTDSDGNPVQGASVTYTANVGTSGASGTFTSTTSITETQTTGANGTASASDLVANSIAGGFTVTASSGTLTPVSFNLTNAAASAPALAAGNYVFSVTGEDINSPYWYAGTFTVVMSGGVPTISAGEQDFSDLNNPIPAEAITGGSIGLNPNDSDLLITLNFTDSYINGGAGSVTFDVSMVSPSKGALIEYDNWASGSGELDLQATSLPTPAGGYAFFLNGFDSGECPFALGGVVDVDDLGGTTGTISGAGSIFDFNDCANPVTEQTFTASSISYGPDQYGLVTFSLNTADFTGSNPASITLDGYMVDATHIRLIENWFADDLQSITGGTALGQTGTGQFSSSSISGSTFVAGTIGYDYNGAEQMAGALTFNADGSISGNVSFNDGVAENPTQGGYPLTAESGTTPCSGGSATTACYTIDGPGVGVDGGTGRVTLTNVTDGITFNYYLQAYLDGNGHVLVISMDDDVAPLQSVDVLAGVGVLQTPGTTFTNASLNGPYVVNITGYSGSGEGDQVGVLDANGSTPGTLTGFFDSNLVGGPQSYNAATAGYQASSTNGVFDITPTNGELTLYLADPVGGGVVIENDPSGLSLGPVYGQQ
jgi:hypothetical protein